MRPPSWVCCELALVLAAWLPWVAPASAQVVELTQAEFVLSESDRPPPEDAAWTPVTLPDVWWRTRPQATGSGWFRIAWPIEQVPPLPQALYLAKLGRVGEAWVNGALVGRNGSLEQPELTSQPLLFAVDPATLRVGRNTVHLRLRTTPLFSGVVTAVQVGDAAALRPVYEARRFAAATGPQLQFGAALVLAVFMFVLAAKRPRERTLGWFGLGSLMYCLFLLDWVLVVAPVAPANWMIVRGFALQGINIGTLMFALRYGGWRWPRVEPLLWLTVPLVALAYGLAARDIELPVDVFWLQTASILAYVGTFGAVAWRRRSLESIALFVASPGCFLDGLIGTAPEGVSLFPYSFLLLFVLMGGVLLSRFARSLGEAEQLNAQLEQRVEGKRVELERKHEQVRALEQQQAVAAERQRIMSDMHDGIGGQLIATLGLVEHGQASPPQVAAALRECIDDLRLVIDSIEPVDDDLLPVLGNLRYRLEGRLRQQGIVLDWQVSELPRMPGLTPQHLLQILRILQEAFTNVLKHARATRIRVGTGVDAGRVSIVVADDGQGFMPADAGRGRGRGLANMVERARCIGGELRITPSDRGTTLALLLPVH